MSGTRPDGSAGSAAAAPDAQAADDALQARGLYNPKKAALLGSAVEKPSPVRRRKAILVGINSYVHSSIAPLRYCVNDILEMQELLESRGYKVYALHDQAASAEYKPTFGNVTGMLDFVSAGLGPDDMLLVQLSCHGVLAADGCVLLMQDNWLNPDKQDGLRVEELRRVLAKCKARQKVLLLDACHSGARAGKGAAPDTVEAEAAFNRRVSELAEGFALLSSSTEGQLSHESRERQHGVFTSFVLDGLRGQAARAPNRFVTVDDLKHYVQAQLVKWSDEHPGRSVQQPTAQTAGTGDIILVDLPEARTASSTPPLLHSPDPLIVPAATAPGYAPTAELLVVCGCDRDEQWSVYQRLVRSRESWLFLVPGPRGEAHELFVDRMVAECRTAFPDSPPPRPLRVSWRRRQFPPAVEADYRHALAQALGAAAPETPALVERLRELRERHQLLLVHPVLDRGHRDPELVRYYYEFLPSLIAQSRSERTLGVKLVQPIEWRTAGPFARLLARLLTALLAKPPESARQALSLGEAQRLMKQLEARWSGELRLSVLPALSRISAQDIRQFLSSQDLSSEEQERILSDLEPIDRESTYLLRDLMLRLPEYKDTGHARI